MDNERDTNNMNVLISLDVTGIQALKVQESLKAVSGQQVSRAYGDTSSTLFMFSIKNNFEARKMFPKIARWVNEKNTYLKPEETKSFKCELYEGDKVWSCSECHKDILGCKCNTLVTSPWL